MRCRLCSSNIPSYQLRSLCLSCASRLSAKSLMKEELEGLLSRIHLQRCVRDIVIQRFKNVLCSSLICFGISYFLKWYLDVVPSQYHFTF